MRIAPVMKELGEKAPVSDSFAGEIRTGLLGYARRSDA